MWRSTMSCKNESYSKNISLKQANFKVPFCLFEKVVKFFAEVSTFKKSVLTRNEKGSPARISLTLYRNMTYLLISSITAIKSFIQMHTFNYETYVLMYKNVEISLPQLINI